MDDGLDYNVHTKVRFQLDLEGGAKHKSPQSPDTRQAFARHVEKVYNLNDTLCDFVRGRLNFRFDGCYADLIYVFPCHDENPAETASFSRYCVRQVQEELESFGCKITQITCKAEEADMAWLDKLEDMVFGPKGSSPDSARAGEHNSRKERLRVRNFMFDRSQDAFSALAEKLEPCCPTLACIAGNIPAQKLSCWTLEGESYRIRSAEVQLCLSGLIGHAACLAAQGREESLPALRDFIRSVAVFWPEDLDNDDPKTAEERYSRRFDQAVAAAKESGQAPELSAKGKEDILIGLENYIIDLAGQYSQIDQEALDGGLGSCEAFAASLRQTWVELWEPRSQEPTQEPTRTPGQMTGPAM